MLRQAVHQFTAGTRGKGFYEITREAVAFVREQRMLTGLLTVYCRHTSASLLIQENADPDVRVDLNRFFEDLAPEDPGRYVHTLEGPDDMPAHIRAALTQTQLSIPLVEGRLALGTWQGVYLFEHRNGPEQRTIVLHLIGE